MDRTLTISEPLYTKLELSTLRRGLNSIVELLELWINDEETKQQRRQVVSQIDSLRERLRDTYGEMNDSVSLVRQDRGR